VYAAGKATADTYDCYVKHFQLPIVKGCGFGYLFCEGGEIAYIFVTDFRHCDKAMRKALISGLFQFGDIGVSVPRMKPIWDK